MSGSNLQTVQLEQYIQVQGSENDPIYQKCCEQEQEILQRYEELLDNSKEYKTYVEAKKTFENAEKNWEEFEGKLDEKCWKEVDGITSSAFQERKLMLNQVDPDHENFNQCSCGKIIKKENNQNCAVLNCATNKTYCTNCRLEVEDYIKRTCQFCNALCCSTKHHFKHVKKCRKYAKNNICGFASDTEIETEYPTNYEISDKVAQVIWYGKVDTTNFCNKISQNIKLCSVCGTTFCPDCSGGLIGTDDFMDDEFIDHYQQFFICHSKECQDPQNQECLFDDL